jgi:hypothetical protein
MTRPPIEKPFSELNSTQAIADFQEAAEQLRQLIATQPPQDLLGYLYATMLMTTMDEGSSSSLPKQGLEHGQFLLEYVHATWASTQLVADATFDEIIAAQIVRLARDLRERSLIVAMMIAARSPETQFGDVTRTLLFQALSSWVLLRGHRYQVLEEEFFRYALAPHDDALRRAYGVGADEIAAGIQAAADTVLHGHDRAMRTMRAAMLDAEAFVEARGLDREKGNALWLSERAELANAAREATTDLLRGGICNLSRHTSLPAALLDDLSYAVAEESEFFAPGLYAGTPFRSLPARKKPLIKLGDHYYLTDPSFVRDAAYRAILYHLLERAPDYASTFKENQKAWSEAAYAGVLADQLRGATVLNEVYYKRGGNWFENDTLILLDGVLLLVEAKSGAAATIASPAESFDRHARSVRDLIVKAHDQCQRFLEYLASADEVPLYALRDGRHIEVARIRLADYDFVLPIGLTVESYSPFSTSAKQLPGVSPLLGKHPFISVAIDELFVLARFLPSTGALVHYLRNRQTAAGVERVFLVDEFDHLGAYIRDNLFIDALAPHRAENPDLIVVDGASDIVDEYFGRADWATTKPPSQPVPKDLQDLFDALDRSRAPGWIDADNRLRDFGNDGREDVARQLAARRGRMQDLEHATFALRTEVGLLFWLHRAEETSELGPVEFQAQAIAEAFNVERVLAYVIGVDRNGQFSGAIPRWLTRAAVVSEALREKAEALRRRAVSPAAMQTAASPPVKMPGRNEPCWCSSGIKFKRCHGR